MGRPKPERLTRKEAAKAAAAAAEADPGSAGTAGEGPAAAVAGSAAVAADEPEQVWTVTVNCSTRLTTACGVQQHGQHH